MPKCWSELRHAGLDVSTEDYQSFYRNMQKYVDKTVKKVMVLLLSSNNCSRDKYKSVSGYSPLEDLRRRL